MQCIFISMFKGAQDIIMSRAINNCDFHRFLEQKAIAIRAVIITRVYWCYQNLR